MTAPLILAAFSAFTGIVLLQGMTLMQLQSLRRVHDLDTQVVLRGDDDLREEVLRLGENIASRLPQLPPAPDYIQRVQTW